MCDSCAPPPGTSTEPNTASESSDRARALHHHIARAVLTQRQAMRAIALGFAAVQRDRLFRELGFAALVEYGELEHLHLQDFEGPMGSWPSIQGYWGAIEPPADLLPPAAEEPDHARQPPPRGRARFVLGDEERPAPEWMGLGVPV